MLRTILQMLIAALLLPLSDTLAPARAAETTAPSISANEKPGGPEFGPRGQHATREIKYGDWAKFCFKGGGAKMVCRTTINGTWETGQSAVRVDLIEREGDGTARLQIFLPVGLYLQAGVKLTVDQEAPYSIPYSWCLSNGCIAGELADARLVRAMEAGTKLQVEVVDTNILTLTTTVPLDRFEAVRKGAPTQLFEQTIVE